MLDKRLLARARKERQDFYLALGTGFLTGILAILQAFLLARVINNVFLKGQGLNEVSRWLFLLVTVLFLRAGSSWLGEAAARKAGTRIKHALRQEILQHLFSLGPIPRKGLSTGERVNLLVEGVETLEAYFAKYLPQLVLAVIVPLSILFVVFPLDWVTGLILILTAPLLPIFMILIGGWAEKMAKRQWAVLNRMSGHFFQVLQGMTTLKLLGRSKRQIEVVARLSREWRDTTLGVLRIAFISAFALEFLVTISTAMIAVGLGLRLIGGGIEFERAMFILLLAPEFYIPLRLLGTGFHAGLNGVSAAEDIFALLDEPVPVEPVTVESFKPDQQSSTCSIFFQDVHYSYDGERPVLKGITFKIHPGERVALVGQSGSGKSTVINMLMGFIVPDGGKVLINEHSLANTPLEEWRRHLSLVPQKPHLFNGTVRENICLSRADCTEKDMITAATLAKAHGFIEKLPQGYETPIGSGGLGLSAGQEQRIALARAFLAQTPILILDEATAGLDTESEWAVQQGIEKLIQGSTVLLIAHRPATLKLVDRIIVLEEGRVVEEGTPEELINSQGAYFRLFQATGGMEE